MTSSIPNRHKNKRFKPTEGGQDETIERDLFDFKTVTFFFLTKFFFDLKQSDTFYNSTCRIKQGEYSIIYEFQFINSYHITKSY